MLDEARRLEAIEIELLLDGIARHYGYDFRGYSPASLGRRIRLIQREERAPTISALQDRILHDPEAMTRFVRRISVHATSMFRDPAFFGQLRRRVVPLLRTYPFIRIWNAGCASGEEAYSLAVVLHEEGLYERSRIYATDMSDSLLLRARTGIFNLAAMREYTTNYQRAGGTREFSEYYTADYQSAILREFLRKNVVFAQHNLVTDGPFNEFHLVLCRNVMIYFNRKLRDRVHDLIYHSLVRLGVLGLGQKESLRTTPHETHYAELDSDMRLYRRVA